MSIHLLDKVISSDADTGTIEILVFDNGKIEVLHPADENRFDVTVEARREAHGHRVRLIIRVENRPLL